MKAHLPLLVIIVLAGCQARPLPAPSPSKNTVALPFETAYFHYSNLFGHEVDLPLSPQAMVRIGSIVQKPPTGTALRKNRPPILFNGYFLLDGKKYEWDYSTIWFTENGVDKIWEDDVFIKMAAIHSKIMHGDPKASASDMVKLLEKSPD